MTKKFDVKIRFNTLFLKDKTLPKWRVLVEGVEYQVDDVEIHSKSYTTNDFVKGDDGELIEKWHITTKAKNINLVTTKGVTKAILK
jgi:hypothetical protein